MEPKLPAPERFPEYRPSSLISSVEKDLDIGSERVNEQQEKGVEQAAKNQADLRRPILPPPVLTQQSSAVGDPSTPVSPSDDTPLVANDDDLIEKEWVDKAKQILATTKDDPYRREQEVGRLQVEYLKKRYGKELAELE